MSNPAHAWLDRWRGVAPPSLTTTVEQALTTAGDGAGDAAAALAAAALACLRTALRIGDDRAAALQLLAADALITAACEAAAGSGRGLDELAPRFSADRLATQFREELSADDS